MSEVKETPRIGQGKPGPGRPKGIPNKSTKLLKDMILAAAEQAGNDIQPGEGAVAYLKQQSKENPSAFMSLLGRVLPTQVTGDPENPLHVKSESDAQFGAVIGLLGEFASGKQSLAGGESLLDQERETITVNATR